MDTLYTKDAYESISAFLSNYVEDISTPDKSVAQGIESFKNAIKLLLENRIFSSKIDMKIECLKDYNIIIPDFLFPESQC